MAERVILLPGTLRRVCQLTGAWHRSRGGSVRAFNHDECAAVGLRSTDLGSSFSAGNRVYFLFGDSTPGPLLDAVAWTEDTTPEAGLTLTFARGDNLREAERFDGKWLPLRIPGKDGGRFEVPTGGFEGPQGNLYVILTTDVDIAVRDMGRSVLLRAGDPFFGTLTEITTISQATKQDPRVRFINVAPVKLADGASLGLPGAQILWFGTGLYRQSDVYLAAIPASSIERKETWKYWDGAGWAESELRGRRVIESGNLGEISAAWVSALGRWLLIGTRDEAGLRQRQLVYYTAKDPRGPWDGPREIFAASVDRKLDADLFHRAWTPGSFESDRLYDKGQGEGGGIEYGGYIVERYIKTVRPGVADVYFTLSTWNPYQVALMCARFVRGDDFRDETFHFVDTLALNVLDETVRELAQIAEKSQVEAPVREIVSAGHLLLDRIAAVVEPRSAAGLTLRRVRDAAKLAGEFAERAVLDRGRVAREVGGVALIQSNFGRLHRNFEVAAPATQGGIRVRAGSNDGNSVSWGATLLEGATTPRMYFDALAMLQSTVPDPVEKPPPAERWSGRLIVAGNDDGRLAFLWRERDAPFRWHGPFPVIAVDDSTDARAPFTRVRGNPALIQSTFGLRRNDFELIAPDARAGIRHYHQDNRRDLPFSPDWQVGETFCEHLGLVDAVSMIQGAFGDPGNLEVVARCGSRLHHCWRAGNAWGDGLIRVGGRAVEGVSGIPALALSRFGRRSRNFELLTPLIAGGLAHYFRDNDPEDPGEGPWHFVEIVDPGTIYLSVSLVHSTIGDRGLNLEAVALTASREVVRVSRSVTAGHFQRLELLFSI